MAGSTYPIKVKSIMKIIRDNFSMDVKFNTIKSKNTNFILDNKKILKNKLQIVSTKKTIICEINNLKNYSKND